MIFQIPFLSSTKFEAHPPSPHEKDVGQTLMVSGGKGAPRKRLIESLPVSRYGSLPIPRALSEAYAAISFDDPEVRF